MTTSLISVIVPVLNEAQSIEGTLAQWQARRGADIELIVVDGGSTDESVKYASSLADKVLVTEAGRARQMNYGAKNANGHCLLFLHADTMMPSQAYQAFLQVSKRSKNHWGFFLVTLNNSSRVFRVIETLMNWRSRITAVATGDQCIFVSRSLFENLDGYQDILLMEDVEITKRLRTISKPIIVSERVSTSTRRWEHNGVLSTVLKMWRLRLAYFFGASPEKLHRQYYG